MTTPESHAHPTTDPSGFERAEPGAPRALRPWRSVPVQAPVVPLIAPVGDAPAVRARRRRSSPARHGGGIVAEVRGTAVSLRTARTAAELAAEGDVVLHLVATYVLCDSSPHRVSRVGAPADIAHVLTPRGDAEALITETIRSLRSIDVISRGHIVRGARGAALRGVAKRVGAVAVLLDAESPKSTRRRMPCLVLDADQAARPLIDATRR